MCIMLACQAGDVDAPTALRTLHMTGKEYERALEFATTGGVNACQRVAEEWRE